VKTNPGRVPHLREAGCVLCLKEIGWCMCDRKTCQQPHRQPADLDVHGYQLCARHTAYTAQLNAAELHTLIHRTNTPRKAT
jgi:hypothetical protein